MIEEGEIIEIPVEKNYCSTDSPNFVFTQFALVQFVLSSTLSLVSTSIHKVPCVVTLKSIEPCISPK